MKVEIQKRQTIKALLLLLLMISQMLQKLRKSNAKKPVIAKKSKRLRIPKRKERNRVTARVVMPMTEGKNGRVVRVQVS